MLTTVMLIGDKDKASNIVNYLQDKYDIDQDFKKLIDEFSYSHILDEWNTIVTL